MGIADDAPEDLVAEYARVAKALYPKGLAWSDGIDSNLRKTLLSQGDTWGRVDKRGDDLLRESDPRTTNELLGDWERVLGLPAPCEVLGRTATLRRSAVVAKLTGSYGQSKQAFLDLAEALGWDAADITIVDETAFRVGISAVGDPLQGPAWVFAWRVTAPEVNPIFFAAGTGAAGDPIVDIDNEPLRCFLEELKPAHTQVLVDFTDPYTGYAPWTDIRPSPAVLQLRALPPTLI